MQAFLTVRIHKDHRNLCIVQVVAILVISKAHSKKVYNLEISTFSKSLMKFRLVLVNFSRPKKY
jgi:hypothetical protein